MQFVFCPYSKLGVHNEATSREISSHFRKSSPNYHPDKATDPETKKRLSIEMAERSASYSLITNEVKRKVFDFYVSKSKNKTPEVYANAWEQALIWTGREEAFRGSALDKHIERSRKAEEKAAQDSFNREQLKKMAKEAKQKAEMKKTGERKKPEPELIDLEQEEAKRIYNLEQSFQNLKKQLEREQGTRKQIEKEAAELVKDMQTKMQKVTMSCDARVAELKQILARKQEESYEEKQALEKHVAELLRGKEATKGENCSLQKAMETCIQEQERINNERRLLENQVEGLSHEKDELEAENLSLKKQIEDLIHQNMKKDEQKQSLESQLDLIFQEKQEMQKANLLLKKRENKIQNNSNTSSSNYLRQTKLKRLNKHHQGQPKNNKYQCNQCGKTLKTPLYLRRHMNTHTHEEKCQCTEHGCDQSFPRKDSLIRHLKNSHK